MTIDIKHEKQMAIMWLALAVLNLIPTIVYLIALFSNLTQEQELKIMSTLKLYQSTGTGHVSPAVIDRLAERVGR